MPSDSNPVAEADSFFRGERIAEIVESALERDAAERSQFIKKACGDDVELLAEIDSLLEFQEKASDFIETPAYEVASRLLEGDGELKSGQILGDYKILSLLGEGGMGEVYLVEDTKLGRRVAIKVVKRGPGFASVLRHSRKEERILAGLNHPNIARLYGAGMMPSGLPYFVMEYVDGRQLDRYCGEEQLSIHDRLALFRKICGAVTYAHQNLIIHRDIKPANIRVTADGEPKLLDFGIAKLLDTDASSPGEITMTLAAMMTPEYASPEQVLGESMTTASDVYSLGVVLYELLTGQRPYQIKTRNPNEIARAITEQEPIRPSTAVARGDANSKFQIRNAKLLQGDLDNIVLKALRKEPARRYASIAQFSDDILRYIEGRPVTARKDTFSYRAVKFVNRNKIGVAAAGVVIVAVGTGLILALWQAENARRQRDVAERINTFLQRMLSFSNQSVTSVSPVAQRRDVTVNEMLDQIAPKIEAELADQPNVRAQVQRTIGSAYASQGHYNAAEKNLRAALAAQIQLHGQGSPEVADTTAELGVLSYRQGKFDEANELLQKAVAFYRNQQLGKSLEYDPAKLALALDNLGIVKFYQGDAKGALALLNDALRISSSEELKGSDRRVRTFNKSDLGGALVSLGEREKGERLLREAETEYRQLSSKPPWEFGSTLLLLGVGALKRGALDEAEKHLVEAEQVIRQTLGDNNSYLANTLDAQALVFFRKGALKHAEEKARESLAMFQNLFRDKKFWWATALSTLGDICGKTGRPEEAESYYKQAVAIYEQQPTKNHRLIAATKIQLSDFLLEQNRLAEAQHTAIEAQDEARDYLGNDDSLVKAAADKVSAIRQRQTSSAASEESK